MNIGMNLEIHFHQQDEASVYLESNASGEDEKFGEILLFCCVVLRQMANLGIHHPIASSLATLVMQVSDNLTELVEYEHEIDVKLVEYKGSHGRKRFEAILKYSDTSFNFKFKPKGFGLLARGVGYYAPVSVMILLRYLAKRRIEDQDFILSLSQAAKRCGEVYSGGHYISGQLSVLTQSQIALMIAGESLKLDE